MDTNNKQGLRLTMWKRLLPFAARLKKELIITMSLMAILTIAEVTFPLFTRYVVDHFVVPQTTEGMLGFSIFFLIVILAQGFGTVIWARYTMIVEMKLGPMLKRACFTHLQKLPIDYYSKNSVGYLLARVMSDTDRISGMVAWGLGHLAWGLLRVVCTIMFMLVLSARLAILVVPALAAAVGIMYFINKKIVVVNRRVREINSRITGAYNEGITGAKTTKSLVIEERLSEEFENITSDMYRQSMRAARFPALMMPLMMFCGSVAIGAVLYRGGILVGQQIMDYGTLVVFISYVVGILEPVSQTAGLMSQIVATQACLERVMALLDEPITLSDSPAVLEKYGDEVNPKREDWEPIAGDIEFENVWFRYPDSEKYILQDFNLKIPQGTTVAIVGETGAGKSTIVNLACRFYEPERGRILIDGRDVRERSQLWLHSSLGYVLQDPHLFSGTIMENIRYGKLDATDDEVIAAAKLVSADLVASRMPEGFNSQVGEGGGALSTGEKQLVSFARALIAHPPIFVLDEATSSIDTETEALIQAAIDNVLRDRTSFIIAHRLSTIAKADIIIVIDDGEIVEFGTHGELLGQAGRYAKLFEAMRLSEGEHT